MARPIDADAVLDRYYAEFDRQDICDGSQDRDWLMRCIEEAPTLTPPNEGAKDKNVPANEPLTLEELREMDEPTPVWWKKAGLWCLCERGFIITPNGNIYEFEENNWTFYRRPPEGEEEKP